MAAREEKMFRKKTFHLAVPDLSSQIAETDVFFVDPHGNLRMAWVRGSGTWRPPVQLGPPGILPPGAPLASSLQFGTVRLDVFVVDRAGALNVLSRWVDVGDPNLLAGRSLISPPHHFPRGAHLAVSPQFGVPDQMDVFLVDNKGALNVAWLVNGGSWNAPVAISPPGYFPRKAAVAVSNQYGIADQTDVFAIDRDGALNVAWVVGGGVWNGPVRISQCGRFPPGAPVVASNQFGLPDQTDVFAVDCEGALNVAWVVGSGPWNGPVRISPPCFFPPGAHLAVSKQFGVPNQTDVFAIGTNGGLHVSWVVGAGAWNGPVQISSSSLFAAGAPLAAANQAGIPDQTDVFGPAVNGGLDVAWVVGSGTWNGPVQIGPPMYPIITVRVVEEMGRFVEITGRWFARNATVTIDYNIQENGPTSMIGQDVVTTDARGRFVHAIPVTFTGDIQWISVVATDLASGATGNESIYY
jgi:hypothetical protein